MTDRRYSTSRWQRLRLAILDRDGWSCRVRGRGCVGIATTVDHVEAIAEGGEFWDPANLRASCLPCNARRGGETSARLSATRGAGGRAAASRRDVRL